MHLQEEPPAMAWGFGRHRVRSRLRGAGEGRRGGHDLLHSRGVRLHQLEGGVPFVDLIRPRAVQQVDFPVPEEAALQGTPLRRTLLHKPLQIKKKQ